MRGSRKVCQRGSNFDNFFLDDPSKYHYKRAIEMAFCWRADNGPKVNADLVALRFFRGSGPVLLRNLIVL